MISQNLKNVYYSILCLPMWLNGRFFRAFLAPRKDAMKVHLGPGSKKYIKGWLNVDGNLLAKHDVWANFQDSLPFPDNSVDVFYSHHVIEHLPNSILASHFKEMYRCLKPGACIRIAGPNGDAAISRFLEQDTHWFNDWPDNYNSIGGRLVNFLLCRNQHATILTYSYLCELAENAGFTNVIKCRPHFETKHPEIIDALILQTEKEKPCFEYPDTLVVECEKSIIG